MIYTIIEKPLAWIFLFLLMIIIYITIDASRYRGLQGLVKMCASLACKLWSTHLQVSVCVREWAGLLQYMWLLNNVLTIIFKSKMYYKSQLTQKHFLNFWNQSYQWKFVLTMAITGLNCSLVHYSKIDFNLWLNRRTTLSRKL